LVSERVVILTRAIGCGIDFPFLGGIELRKAPTAAPSTKIPSIVNRSAMIILTRRTKGARHRSVADQSGAMKH
jgi:hypothetical protein